MTTTPPVRPAAMSRRTEGKPPTTWPEVVEAPDDQGDLEVEGPFAELDGLVPLGEEDPGVLEVAGLRDRLLSRSQLAALPPVRPLIDGVLSRPSAAVLVGATGTGKTFTALGMAAAVATGQPWLGRAVHAGPVLYVVGEGASGLDARMAAWEHAWNHDVLVPDHRLRFLVQPGSLLGRLAWAELAALAVELHCVLVVIDTLSSVMYDADEVKDAPGITRRLADLAAAIDGTALLVHHPGWSDAGRVRGGSQLEANVDEVLVLASPAEGSDVVTLTQKKVKEGAAGKVMWLHRRRVLESLVIESADPADRDLPVRERIVAVLTMLGDVGATGPQLMAEVGTDDKGRSAFYKALRKLEDAGDITAAGPARARRFVIAGGSS